MWQRLLGAHAVFTLCAISAGNSLAVDRDQCFRLYESLELVGQESRTRICATEIPKLMRTPLKIYPGYEMEWPPEMRNEKITTCEKYLAKVGFGMYTFSRADFGVEIPFLRTCGVLSALASARQGKSRFARSGHVLDLRNLPPSIVIPYSTGDQFDELAKASANGKSAYDVILETGDLSFLDVNFALLAEGDINGDGVTDYVVERSYGTATDGNFTVGYLSFEADKPFATWILFDKNNAMWPRRSKGKSKEAAATTQ